MFLNDSAGRNSSRPSCRVSGNEGNIRQCSPDGFALETLALPFSSLHSLPGVSLHCRAIRRLPPNCRRATLYSTNNLAPQFDFTHRLRYVIKGGKNTAFNVTGQIQGSGHSEAWLAFNQAFQNKMRVNITVCQKNKFSKK